MPFLRCSGVHMREVWLEGTANFHVACYINQYCADTLTKLRFFNLFYREICTIENMPQPFKMVEAVRVGSLNEQFFNSPICRFPRGIVNFIFTCVCKSRMFMGVIDDAINLIRRLNLLKIFHFLQIMLKMVIYSPFLQYYEKNLKDWRLKLWNQDARVRYDVSFSVIAWNHRKVSKWKCSREF